MPEREDYARAAASLLPEGPFWEGFRAPDGLGRAVLDAKAGQLAELDRRGRSLIAEANPSTALEMLPDWEATAGLPDGCSSSLDDVVPERRAALLSRLVGRGGQSLAYFRDVAAALGYEIEIAEVRPFIAGWSRCGDLLGGGEECRFDWLVTVQGPRLTEFRAGASACGEPLGRFSRAEELECVLRRLAPAHTLLTVTYMGV